MYLLPRLIGVSIYTLILLFVCLLISKSNKRSNKIYLNIYILVLASMGFFFVPHMGSDLTRLLPRMHIYDNYSFAEILSTMLTSHTPSERLYYYFIIKFNSDGMLPAITCLITFGMCFSLLKRCFEKINSTSADIALVLLMFMSRGLLMHTIGNVRTMLSISIISWCIYTEIEKERKITSNLLFYLFAATMHVMGQALFVIRIALLFFEKSMSVQKKILRYITIIVLMFLLFEYGEFFVNRFVAKADVYLDYSSNGIGYSYFWEGLLSIMSVCLLIYMIWQIKRNEHFYSVCNNPIVSRRFLNIILLSAFVDIIFFKIEFNFAQRYSFFLTILSMPIGLCYLKYCDVKKKSRYFLIVMSLVMLFISCARGDLCSLKFWI